MNIAFTGDFSLLKAEETDVKGGATVRGAQDKWGREGKWT